MAFDRQFLDELIARNDIVDVVSNYVSLQPRGGSLWGCCPFHSEKTPSFHVLPDKQLCYCFGCKKGGGVINFIMEEENLSFPMRCAFWRGASICRCRRKSTATRAGCVRASCRSTATRRAFTTISSTRPRVRRCSSI